MADTVLTGGRLVWGRSTAEEVGNPEHTKALPPILIAELRVDSRAEILPTYRIATPTVCATTTSVGDPGLEPGTSSLSEKRSNRLS
jgi:hypothetical protein